MHGGEAPRGGALRADDARARAKPSLRRARTASRTIGLAMACGTVVVPLQGQGFAPELTQALGSGGDPTASHPSRAAFRSEDWVLSGIMLGALATSQLEGLSELDAALSPGTGRGETWDRRIPRSLGRVEVVGGLAFGTWLVGAVTGSETVWNVGTRSIEALMVNAVLTTSLKVGVGRARPDSGLDEDDLRPGSLSANNWSFPSGHTSSVFALATIVSSELGDEAPWVPYVAYPIAAWTGASRVMDSRHWFTDVVAGAALGVLSGRLVSRLHGHGLDETPASGVTPRVFVLSDGGAVGVGVQIVH